MDDYLAPAWRDALRHSGLDNFDALWELEAEWFEPPNQRRGGWSGVMRIELVCPDSETVGLFLKRQDNHTRPTLLHPLHGEPTFAAEMRNVMAMQRAGVGALEPVYFAQRKVNGRWRVILMTRELVGFRPLEEWVEDWHTQGWEGSQRLRRQVIAECSTVLRRLHQAGFVHNAMHPKHVFLSIQPGDGVEVRLIDLEKMRRKVGLLRRAVRDLDSLNRRSPHWSTADRLRFLRCYRGGGRLDAVGRLMWRLLARRYVKKMGSAGG